MQIAGPPAPETLSDDQLARRQRIVKVALRSLARNNYEDIKINDLARDANVALGTLYRYFASKEHLLAVAFMEWQSVLKVKLERFVPAGATEAERLSEVFRQVTSAFELQPRFFRFMTILHDTTDPYAAAISSSTRSVFNKTVEDTLGGPLDADQNAIVRTVSAVFEHAMRNWIMQRLTIDDVYERLEASIRLIYHYCPEGSPPSR
ncbi:TetR/AcrR family transcriptional regulator [Frankia sp. AgB32]|uniref:TetR/AcrR family transcriptional regulator n=1 Tax=Frankia sp. AgB32 TaxID=631119 RepID=UPI00201061CE|nr:TetR/AcrR family transcriptional regulator [Frankia sp. AgB32]MCK9897793.1 TetR family transcriptional regulator [Frankia sp. AgB32]MCL9794582.1 TetR family transcriptional regulator [Frankia sp. AgKG'84/4]